jgi:hypothetical protein
MAEAKEYEVQDDRIYTFASKGKLAELTALLEEHPEVDVDGCKDSGGSRALFRTCSSGHTECARLLIDYGADVNAANNFGSCTLSAAVFNGHLNCAKLLVQNRADVNRQRNDGWTPLISSMANGHLTTAAYLHEQKADLHYRVSKEGRRNDEDALHFAMRKYATRRTPSTAFAFLSCNTDAKNVKVTDNSVSIALREAHMEAYKHIQAFIDEHHRILLPVLSEHVPVDPRFGLGQMGIYQEPLERTLEYLGLSMSEDQVVNASIDGEDVRRALIPGHLLNANHWFNKYTSRKLQ